MNTTKKEIMQAKLTKILRQAEGFLLSVGAGEFWVLKKGLHIIHKIDNKQWKHYYHDDNKGLIEVFPFFK